MTSALIGAFGDELCKLGAPRALASRLTPGSSNVHGYRYDSGAKQLFVTYKSGGTYRYDGVPAGVAKSLDRNKSAGKTINRLVKAKGYDYEKVGSLVEKNASSLISYFGRHPNDVMELATLPTELMHMFHERDERDQAEKAKATALTAMPGVKAHHPRVKLANGDMLQYYQDHPDKLKAKQKREQRKRHGGHNWNSTRHHWTKQASAIAEYFHHTSREMAKLAGVAKRQLTWHGLRMKIEHDPGDIRSGKSKDGQTWERKMSASYGYIAGTGGQGDDGEAIDIYFAPDPVDGPVFKVDQQKKDGGHDEDKFMVGWPDADSAKKAYLQHMPEWAFGSISQAAKDAESFAASIQKRKAA